MKTLTVPSAALNRSGRLDSWYFNSPANLAAEMLAVARERGVRFAALGEALASKVTHPARTKRYLAAPGEPSLPYLRPYDVFSYLPEAADYVSARRTKTEIYQVRKGDILQTRSGRNLGPAVMADEYLSRFVLSDDMIRITVDDEATRHYVLAYLKSATGQAMLRRSKTGSVIDHLSEKQVAGQEVPIFGPAIFREISTKMGEAVGLRSEARLELQSLIEEYDSKLPRIERQQPMREGWTVRSTVFAGRLDVAFYDPVVGQVKRDLRAIGGVPVSDVAKVAMLGRYKRLYTTPPFGRPIISGAQLLQSKPIHPQQILPQSFNRVEDFELVPGTIAYPSDGRAEEGLGTPVVVTEDRRGWLASNMVGRIFPNDDVKLGWLYLALQSRHAQMQFKATASGSVVDHTYPENMESVILPPELDVDMANVKAAWDKFSKAQVAEDEAVAMMEATIENPPQAD